MRWFGWFRRRATRPDIPPHVPEPREPVQQQHTPVQQSHPAVRPQPKPEPGIEVHEHDVSAMSRTGIHRAWRKLSGKE